MTPIDLHRARACLRISSDLPCQLFVALPFVAALLALVGLMGRSSPPHAMGHPYQRSTR